MKIAIITSGILPVPAVQGGAVENLIDYALEYNDIHHIHDITIYSVKNKKTSYHNALLSSVNHYVYIDTKSLIYKIGAKMYSYFGNYYYYHYQLEYFFERVWRKMKKHSYDLIIIENRPGYTIPLSKRTSTPIILHIHTNILFEPSDQNKKIISSVKGIFAVSNFIKNEILKVGVKSDIRIVYNGLDPNLFNTSNIVPINRKELGFKELDFIAVFWGRLVANKGIKELLQAFLLLKKHKDIKLLIIGAINFEDSENQSNSFVEELKKIATDLDGHVTFTGFIPYNNIANYLLAANVAVIPSHINEAFGMTCIEACAVGLPVIATNDGGIPETLVDQKHILLDVSPQLPQLIANAILEIKNNYSSYQGNSLKRIFHKDSYAKSFFQSLSNIINQS